MKRYLIMGSYFEPDMIKNTNYVLENLDGSREISVFSPVMLPSVGGKSKKDFFLALLAIAKAMTNENLPFTEKEEIQIVIGNTQKEIGFDEILVIDRNIVSTQEAYYQKILEPKLKEKIDLYTIDNATEEFDTIEEALEYILGE